MTGPFRGWRALLLGAAALALPIAIWHGVGAGGAARWAEVARRDLVVTVAVEGTLEAVESMLLGPPPVPQTWRYEIAFLVPEGTEVEAETEVLGFDSSKLERTLEEVRAAAETAAKDLEKLEADLEIRRRDDELALAEAEGQRRRAELKLGQPEEIVAVRAAAEARLDLELATRRVEFCARRLELIAQEERTSLEVLREKRSRADRRITEIEESIDDLTVRTPGAGTVAYVSDHEGEKAKVGESVWRGDKVLEVLDLSRMRAAGEVSEIAAGRVAPGQPVTLRLDAHPDVVFSGRVSAIERAVKQRSRSDPSKVFRLQIELDETDPQRMRPGMRFQGSIEISRSPQALVIPTAAVFATARGPVVFRAGPTGRKVVYPELGRRSDDAVEVVAGLRAGDRVALTRREESE